MVMYNIGRPHLRRERERERLREREGICESEGEHKR